MSGVGPIGCLLVAALKALGAAEIVCADLSPRCGDRRANGADRCLHAADDDVSDYQQDKGYFDVAFEVAGHPQSLQRCRRSPAPKAPWCRWAWAAASPISR